MPAPSIDELVLADDAEAWRRLGFTVEGDVVAAGTVRIRLAGRDAGRGVVDWSLRDIADAELDGLPTRRSSAPPAEWAPQHPNGSRQLDHVVAFSPALDRTIGALEAAGLELRMLREGPTPGGAMRQAFFRLAEVILEVIEQPEPPDRSAPARLWGAVFVVDDLEPLAELLGDDLGSARDAVQPGRRIATLRRSAGLAIPVAFITPEPEGRAPAVATL